MFDQGKDIYKTEVSCWQKPISLNHIRGLSHLGVYIVKVPREPLMAPFWWRWLGVGGSLRQVEAASNWDQRLIVSILGCVSLCSFYPL